MLEQEGEREDGRLRIEEGKGREGKGREGKGREGKERGVREKARREKVRREAVRTVRGGRRKEGGNEGVRVHALLRRKVLIGNTHSSYFNSGPFIKTAKECTE